MKKAWVLSYPLSAQRRLWSDWADAQADMNRRLAYTHFVGFAMSWLKLSDLAVILTHPGSEMSVMFIYKFDENPMKAEDAKMEKMFTPWE